MRRHDRAVEEQLRSLICPVQGIEKGKSGSRATTSEITGFRRRTEDILIGMIDSRSKGKSYKDPEPTEIMKKRSHKRKRGPRSLEAQQRRHSRRY